MFDKTNYEVGNFEFSFAKDGSLCSIKDNKRRVVLALSSAGIFPLAAKIDFDEPPRPTNFGIRGIQKAGRFDFSGRWIPENYFEEDKTFKITRTGGQITASYFVGDFTFFLKIKPAGELVEMFLGLEYLGKPPAYLRAIRLNLPPFLLNTNNSFYYIADPRIFPNQFRTARDIAEGSFLSQDEPKNEPWSHRLDCVLIKGKEDKPSFLLYAHSGLKEGVGFSYSEIKDHLSFSCFYSSFARLHETRKIEVGPIQISQKLDSWQEAEKMVFRLRKRAGIKAPENKNDFRSSVIYQVHPYAWDFGGFRGVARQLKRIKMMGFDIVYLPPLHPSRCYCQKNLTEIYPSFGTRREFQELNELAHKMEMKVIVDTVPHSMLPNSDVCLQHPEWIARDETGEKMGYSTSNLFMDVTNRYWQDYYSRTNAKWMRKDGFGGFRIDAMCWFSPDWSKSDDYLWPGQKSWGSVSMMNRIHSAIHQANPNAFVLSEVCMLGCDAYYLHHAWSVGFHRTLQEMQKCRDKAQWRKFIKAVKTFIGKRKFSEPAGGISVFSLRNHDMCNILGTEFIHSDRAILTLTCFLDGIPMFLMGIERASENLISHVLALRKKYIRFVSKGREEFNVETPDDLPVVGFSRTKDKESLVVLINLSPRSLAGRAILNRKDKKVSFNFNLPAYDFNIFLYKNGEVRLSEKGFEAEDIRVRNIYARLNSDRDKIEVKGVSLEDFRMEFVYPRRWSWDPFLFSKPDYDDSFWLEAKLPSFEPFGLQMTGFSAKPVWMQGDVPLEWWTDLQARKSTGHFRKVIEVAPNVQEAFVEILAEESFEMYLNGKLVASGGDKNCKLWYPENSYHVERVNVRELLVKGKNCFGFIVNHIGASRSLAGKIIITTNNQKTTYQIADGCKTGPENGFVFSNRRFSMQPGGTFSGKLIPFGAGQNTVSENMPFTVLSKPSGFFEVIIDSCRESLPSEAVLRISFSINSAERFLAMQNDKTAVLGSFLKWNGTRNFCSFLPMPEWDSVRFNGCKEKPFYVIKDDGDYLSVHFPEHEDGVNCSSFFRGGKVFCGLEKKFPPSFGFLAKMGFFLRQTG